MHLLGLLQLKPAAFMLQLLLLTPTRMVTALHDCPMPTCTTCQPTADHDAPGFGFDLSTNYGLEPRSIPLTRPTSAVRLHNGTTIDLAKVQADFSYRELMLRLSRAATVPGPAKGNTLLRWLNKKLGRPATPDVGLLGSFLRQLSDATFDVYHAAALGGIRTSVHSTGHVAVKVAVATPLFPALTPRDLKDALEFAGMGSWIGGALPIPYPQRLSGSREAFAASWLGLCSNFKNFYACEDELEEAPAEMVFYASMTRHTLYASRERYASAFGLDQPALSEYLKEPMNPLFAAARGAALYARWRQEAPFDCIEEEECEERRKLEREGGKGKASVPPPGKVELR
ncbi:hypothetical protein DL767_002961 [Monosporascus sp. MG133]|nr:hypothetical protein DL767_002961 [Monosporascus sp. MG133]